MKSIITLKFEEWTKRIEASENGTTTIDIAHEFIDIWARNIITISFGEDVSQETLELKLLKQAGSS